ncbi:MAG: O-antigen ligase family protein [Clostridia bacterium]|nr:O-antigen ligase family protein [Clostridia bacterium]
MSAVRSKGKAYQKMLDGSFFVRLIRKITYFISNAVKNSIIGRFLISYDESLDGLKGKIGKKFFERSNLSNKIKKIKSHTARLFENSIIENLLKKIADVFLHLSVRSYGVGGLTFGIYCISTYMLKTFVHLNITSSSMHLYVGAGISFISLILIFCKKSISLMLSESSIMSFLLVRVFGIRDYDLRSKSEALHKNTASCIVGMLLGFLSFAISPLLICAAIFIPVAAAMILSSPEFGVMMLFFAVPFLNTMMLVGFILFVAFSYFLKLIRGKRTIKFYPLDLMVLLFAAFIICAGIFSIDPQSSPKVMLVMLAFVMSYFLVSNLITTSLWCRRCIGAMIFGTFIVSAYGIYQYFTGSAATTWQDTSMFSDITGRVVSFFENPNVLGEFLILTIPFLLTASFGAKKFTSKMFLFMMLISSGICLIFTWSRGAWLGFIFAMIIFFMLYNRLTLILLVSGAITSPIWFFLLPSSIINRFSSIGNITDTSTAYRVNIWKGTLSMIKEHFGAGVGLGIDSFQKIYPAYSLPAIENAPHAHNLYLELTAEMGILGLIALLVCIILFVKCALSLTANEKTAPAHRNYAIAGVCGVAAILLQGATDYVWYNYRLFLMFWLIIGITSAVTRCSRIEDAKDEYSLYE